MTKSEFVSMVVFLSPSIMLGLWCRTLSLRITMIREQGLAFMAFNIAIRNEVLAHEARKHEKEEP